MIDEPDSHSRNPASNADALYVGTRTNSIPQVLVKTLNSCSALPLRSDLIRHSPPGLNWGRSGSGQAQLALALLAHASGSDSFALKYHQVFQHEFVARLPKDRWQLSRLQVLQALSFVCEEARTDQEECEAVESGPRKVAVMRALLPGGNGNCEITAHGTGRSTRKAAARALLNLLGSRYLRQVPITDLQIELSIVNASQFVED